MNVNRLLFVLVLITNFSFSQQLDPLFEILYSRDLSTTNKISKADSLILHLENTKYDSISAFYSAYSYWFSRSKIRIFKKAIIYGKKALNIELKKIIKDSSIIREYANDLAYYYRNEGLFSKSIHTYNLGLTYDDSDANKEKIYPVLGFIYLQINDYPKARDYFEASANLLINNPQKINQLRDRYQDLATTNLLIKTKESYIKGQKYGILADSLTTLLPTNLINRYKIKLCLAQLFNQDETLNYEIAKKYYQEALNIAEQQKDTFNIIEAYFGLGDLHNIIDQEKSIKNLTTALSYARENDSLSKARIYSSIGYTYNIKKEYQKGITNKHKGLSFLLGNLEESEISFSILKDSPYKLELLDLFPQLAENYLKYYEVSKNKTHLKKSIHYFKLTDILIDIIRVNSREFKSRLFWRKLSTDLYGKAIRACYLEGNIATAFYFMERNKALLLLEDIANQDFKDALDLPISFIQEETILKKKIFEIEWELKEQSSQLVQDSLKRGLITTQEALSLLTSSIQAKRNNIQITPKITSLEGVQNQLKEDEMAIEYHISIDDGYGIYSNKEKGYALFITKNKYELFEIPNLSTFKEEITKLIDLLKEPFKTEQDIVDYAILSNKIFKQLFPYKSIREEIKGKKLIIVPDSYLSLLPFEVLSISKEKLTYLIQENELHYLYSNSFLKNTQKPNKIVTSFLGIAPVTFKDSELPRLSNSGKEIKSLSSYYKGVSYINTEFSKTAFLEELPNHSIIHLATHANAQDSITPWIAFQDEKLVLEELYLTKNNASLVVLSGCNTTLGTQAIGEGVISLARGFFYSGSQSVLSTLWSIDDTSTTEIMDVFYKNLSEGQTKSAALRSAKLNYIDTHSLSEISPYYWASFILIGENDSLIQGTIQWQWYFLGILMLIVVLFFFFKKQKE